MAILLSSFIWANINFGVIDFLQHDSNHRLQLGAFHSEVMSDLPDLSVSIVKTAEWETLEGFLYSGGSWFTKRKGVHSAILIRHPQNTLLFDSGLGRNIDQQFVDSMPFWLKPFMNYKNHQPARDLLSEFVKNNPVRTIILYHFHWDHISGIEDFQDTAEVWVTKEAYDWMMSSGVKEKLYIQELSKHQKIKWRFIQLNSGPYENFERSFDVFQDNSVVLVPLPGHSPGSLGMFVKLHSGKRIFFTGDTTWVLEGFELPAQKFWAARILADHDQTKIEQTILKVRQLMQAFPDIIIVPAHDYNTQLGIGFFPNFIQ